LEALIGLVIYSTALILCAVALRRYVSAAKKSQTYCEFLCGPPSSNTHSLLGDTYWSADNDLATVERYKLYFHFGLIASYFLEWVTYLVFVIEGEGCTVQRDTYAIHLLGLFFFFLAFCSVVLVWGTSVRAQHEILGLNSSGLFFKVFQLCIFSLIVLYVLILGSAIAYCYVIPDFDDFLQHPAYQLLAMYVACTLLFVSLVILALGSLVHLRMLRARPHMQRERHFWLAIGKLNVTMAVCVICFGIWTAAIVWLATNSDSGDRGAMGISGVWWYTLCRWTPHIVPGLMFLLFMRHVHVRDVSSESLTDTESEAS